MEFNDVVIICFAYNRPNHLKDTLKALSNNRESNFLPIIFFLDGSKTKQDKNLVEEVHIIAKQATFFKSIEIVKSTHNQGLFNSVTSGLKYAFTKFNKVIVVEDDILTSPNFLRYMLDGLYIYEKEKKVASIHGYLPNINKKLPDTFFLPGADCWGWATWKDRWNLFREDAKRMTKEIRFSGRAFEFNLNGNYDYLGMLEEKGKGLNNSWAICWHASCFLENLLTLYPGKTLVKNIGLDDSGENCSTNENWTMGTNLNNKIIKVRKIEAKKNEKAFLIYANFFKFRKIKKLLSISKSEFLVIFKKILRKISKYCRFSTIYLSRPYKNFSTANSKSIGYQSDVITKKVKNSTLKLIKKEIKYERDGTGFNTKQNNLPIEKILKRYQHDLDQIIDFGGGLGGMFLSYDEIFTHPLRKIVLEQEKMVKIGEELIKKFNLDLEIYSKVSQIELSSDKSLLIASCVLSYLPNWELKIKKIIRAIKPKYIFIDRQALSKSNNDKFFVQYVDNYYSENISYPFTVISKKHFIKTITQLGYSLKTFALSPLHRGYPFHYYLFFEKI